MGATTQAPASFDPSALQRVLDGRYTEVRELVRERLTRADFTSVIGIPTAEYRERVFEWMKTLAAEGGTALGFPAEYGGADDPGANVVSFETLALGDLSLLVKVGVQYGLWGGTIQQLGTEIHHDRYLRDTATFALPGAFAMTEAGHGSNVQALLTTATYDPATQEFLISTPSEDARKEYIGNAACHGRLAAVFAQLMVGGQAHGVHALVVPLRDADGNVCKGVRIEDCGEKMGLNGVDNGRIWFDNVRVPRDALLNRYGEVTPGGTYTSPIGNANKRFFTMLGALVQGRVCISAASVTVAKTALTIAVRYGLRRRQFGPPGGEEVAILDYRTQQRRLMPALAKTYALHFAQHNTVLMMLAARGLLTNYADHFEDLNPVGMVTFVASQLVETVLERVFARKIAQVISDVVPSGDERRNLLDRDYQLDLFAWREGHIVASVANRFKRGLSEGYDPFEVFRAVQDHAVNAARAHIDRLVLEAFARAIAGCEEDAALREPLGRLCDLYALSNLEEDRGFFEEHGRLGSARCKQITREVNRLCDEVRGQAGLLVDAFGIPDAVLAAPIGRSDATGA